jgi:hypothetical protein
LSSIKIVGQASATAQIIVWTRMRKPRRRPVHRIPDTELLFADLTTNDVNELTNVVRERLPDGVAIVDVVRYYEHCRYPAEKVYCCICGTHQHRMGFHAVRSDGKEATVGLCCTTHALGKKFVAAHIRNKGERRRQGYLRTIHAFKPIALRITLERMTRAWDRLARDVREARFGLRHTLGPAAWMVLARSASTGTPLTVPRRVLVSKWTGVNDNDDDNANDKDRYTWITADVGRVPGAALFESGDPVDLVADLDKVLNNFHTMSLDTDGYTTGQLQHLVKLLRQGRESLERLLRMRRAAEEVFAPEPAAALAGWVNSNRSKHGHDFPHFIETEGGTYFNEVLDRLAEKPKFVEPTREVLDLLACV